VIPVRALAEASPPKALIRQTLGWMLAPMVVLWPAVVVATYFAATAIADATFDRELRDMTRAVAEEARHRARAATEERQLAVLSALRNDPVERAFAQIVTIDGKVLAGDLDMPRPPVVPEDTDEQVIYIRDGTIENQAVRIGHTWVLEEGAPLVLVQVGDPIARRRGLAGNVTGLVMAMVTVLVPIMVALVWLGLWRGLRPVRQLRASIEARPSDDLSPISPEFAPAELAPLVASLNAQLDRVRRQIDAQRRFVADAAHQLRTPLAGLKAQADAAMREDTVAAARDRLERIEESADRLSRLVAQLLSLARADDALSHTPPREQVELNALLRDVCGSAAEQALPRQVALGFDASQQPVMVPGSPLLLRELFANLVDNAIRYTPDGGDVTVRVEGGPAARVVVEDTGIGIPEPERERIFERFHRVLGTRASGSGLGLAIVRTIADLHRASVRAESPGGEAGTRFVVDFPYGPPAGGTTASATL
jgi:two-component system sensor histidine kinase TctE